MSAGRMLVRQCGRGHEFVAMLDPEREHRKFDRSTQRKQYDDRRWGAAIANPWTPISVLRFLAHRTARRANVIYARTRRAIWGVR